MPVILPREAWANWLGEGTADDVAALLRPYPAERMRAYRVGSAVGNVRNNDASLIEPIADVVLSSVE
jgi:putative SOS response-associated peptidase YedK